MDHFEVRVKNVPETLERLKMLGVLPATRKLWVNRKTVAKLKDDPKFEKLVQEDVWLHDHPEEPWEGPIPDHY